MPKISKLQNCFIALSWVTYLFPGNRCRQPDSFTPREKPFCRAASSVSLAWYLFPDTKATTTQSSQPFPWTQMMSAAETVCLWPISKCILECEGNCEGRSVDDRVMASPRHQRNFSLAWQKRIHWFLYRASVCIYLFFSGYSGKIRHNEKNMMEDGSWLKVRQS